MKAWQTMGGLLVAGNLGFVLGCWWRGYIAERREAEHKAEVKEATSADARDRMDARWAVEKGLGCTCGPPYMLSVPGEPAPIYSYRLWPSCSLHAEALKP